MENKTCYSCKNFKLFTIKEMEQAFKIYEEIEGISISGIVFIGRCKFFSEHPPWLREKYFWQRKNEMGQIDISKIAIRSLKCVHYKHSRNELKAQIEFGRRWKQARMVLTINSKEPTEISLADLMKTKFPKPITENFYCEGYGGWVYECPKNYIRLSEKRRKPILGIACYAGVGWCKLSDEEIEEHRKGRKKYMYYGKNTIYNF